MFDSQDQLTACSNEIQRNQAIKTEPPCYRNQDEKLLSLANFVEQFQSSSSTQFTYDDKDSRPSNRNGDLTPKFTEPHKSNQFIKSSISITNHKSETFANYYRCDQNEMLFRASRSFVINKRSPSGEKRYSCDQCNKSFGKYGDLINHKRTHSGEKPYSCDQCNRSFSQAGNLVVHKRTHSGKKPYSCDQCNKSFSQSGNLVQHKRSHTGEKPYICDQCNRSFNLEP